MVLYRGGGRRAVPSMAYSRPDAANMGLLSDELWPVPQFVSTGAGAYARRKPELRGEAVDPAGNPADTDGNDQPAGLPASVINQYREKLDQEGQEFLARGPRSFEEQLAYAQQVRPNAYENATPASMDDQLRFWQSRDVDWARNFVGPNGVVYVRDDLMNVEKPEARIFRAYENMVGGFKRPKLDDLLGKFDLRDRLEGYSPETKAKIADVESFDRPPSADQAAWRAWAHEQGVNPATWFMGERRPEGDQTDYWFGVSRDVPPVTQRGVFIGPDGFMYRRNDLTRDRAGEIGDALEHQRATDALRDAPPPSWEELYDRALSSGAVFPGSNLGRGYFPRASYTRGSAPSVPRPSWQPPTVQEILRRWGRLGNPRTRALNARLARAGESGSWKHTGGAVDADKAKVEEEYIASPLGDFGLDGRKGSHYVDVTHTGRDGKMTRTQSMSRDPKTGKARLDELNTLLEIWKRVGGNVIGVLKDPPED